MSSINILNIIPLNPEAKFTDSFQFEIVFECLSDLKKGNLILNNTSIPHYIITITYLEVEWKMIYIGNADDIKSDQILDTIEIGPLTIGTMKFKFDAPAPNPSLIPEAEILGVTAILLCCSYNNQEFFRCGYYLNNRYDNEEMNLNIPEKVQVDKLIRSILIDKPRITKFNIDWDNENIQIPTFKSSDNNMFQDGKMTQDVFKELTKEQPNNESSNPFEKK